MNHRGRHKVRERERKREKERGGTLKMNQLIEIELHWKLGKKM